MEYALGQWTKDVRVHVVGFGLARKVAHWDPNEKDGDGSSEGAVGEGDFEERLYWLRWDLAPEN